MAPTGIAQETWVEVKKWGARTLAAVVVVGCAIAFVVPLKWALGIYNIEAYLTDLQSGLSGSEDTIFSYRYDYYPPSLTKEREILDSIDLDPATFANLLFAEEQIPKLAGLPREQRKAILDIRPRVLSSGQRSFYFSAVNEAAVFVDYTIACTFKTGKSEEKQIPFLVDVNKIPIPARNMRQGRKHLDEKDLTSEDVVGILGEAVLMRHTLSLDLFNKLDEPTLAAILSEDLERCAFDAMIFVRDVPGLFVERSAVTWFKDKLL